MEAERRPVSADGAAAAAASLVLTAWRRWSASAAAWQLGDERRMFGCPGHGSSSLAALAASPVLAAAARSAAFAFAALVASASPAAVHVGEERR
eukprot:scaffold106323_cov36-Phaeocystis_antarctica.AAC.1